MEDQDDFVPLLRGKTRTKRDKQFYRSALELQLKSHMANGASADEYSKRARAFIKKINPNLPQPYVEGDISDYLVDLMPPELRESGRLLKYDLEQRGRWLEYEEVISRCQDLVAEVQNGETGGIQIVTRAHRIRLTEAVSGVHEAVSGVSSRRMGSERETLEFVGCQYARTPRVRTTADRAALPLR